MKMKNLVLVAAAVCFFAANVSAALVDIETTADTWIQWSKPDSVKGTNDYIKVGQSDSNNCGKAYTKWEAPADIVSVKSISFYYAGGGASGRTVALKLLARIDGTDNNWDETTTCWANAPFNDVGTRADRAFNESGSIEISPQTIGGFQTGPTADVWITYEFSETESDEIMQYWTGEYAGDSLLTIGLQYNSSHDSQLDFAARDLEGFAPYMTVVTSGPLEGDLNDDGFVGSADLDIVRSAWGQTVEAGCLLCGDPSGDGMVGSADLDIVRANWGATSAAAVPEPCLVALFVAAFALLAARRRR